MLYLTCTTITSIDLAHYGVSRAKGWVSVKCGTMYTEYGKFAMCSLLLAPPNGACENKWASWCLCGRAAGSCSRTWVLFILGWVKVGAPSRHDSNIVY